MKKLKRKYLILMYLIIIGSLVSCFKDDDTNKNDYSATELLEYNFIATQNTVFDLSGISGTIAIVGSSNTDSITVNVAKIVESYSVEEAERWLDDIIIDTSNTASLVEVSTDHPNSANGRNFIVNYIVTVPNYVELQISNINGTIEIDSINNDIIVNNVNGNIYVDEIDSNATIELVNGIIFGKIINPSVEIIFSATNGNIYLQIPQNTSAEFLASKVSGIITIDDLVLQDQITSMTTMQGTFGNGDGNIVLSTVNGNIDVIGF